MHHAECQFCSCLQMTVINNIGNYFYSSTVLRLVQNFESVQCNQNLCTHYYVLFHADVSSYFTDNKRTQLYGKESSSLENDSIQPVMKFYIILETPGSLYCPQDLDTVPSPQPVESSSYPHIPYI